MNALYTVAGITKQGFYKRLKSEGNKIMRQFRVEDLVKEVRKDHPRMGSRPMYYKLKIKEMGINKFENIISESGLGVRQKRKRIITTLSNPYHKHYPNLTYGKKLTDVNQLWVTDITYLPGARDTYYISMMQDVYSRRILGFCANDNMFAEKNVMVLDQSMELRGIKNYYWTLMHHSDKGSQFTCNEYLEKLKSAEIIVSMANNSLENPYSERLNGIIKNDYLAYFDIFNLTSLIKALEKTVWLYNHKRPHSELGYLTPVDYENYLKTLNPNKRKTMILYDFNEKSNKNFK